MDVKRSEKFVSWMDWDTSLIPIADEEKAKRHDGGCACFTILMSHGFQFRFQGHLDALNEVLNA